MTRGDGERSRSANRALISRTLSWLPAAIVLLAFTLRIYRIQVQSIWWDEGISVYLARLDPRTILSARAGSQHPPLYYLLLQCWTRVGGFSEFSVRFFSLLSGVILIALVYWVMDRIFDRPTALVSMLIVALNPAYVIYSQEARVYIMLPLAFLFILSNLHRLVRGEFRPRDWWSLALWEALSLYLHYFSVFSIVCVNCFIALLWWRRRDQVDLHRWVMSQLLVGLILLPWGVTVAAHWEQASQKLGYRRLAEQSVTIAEFGRNVWHFFNGGKIEIIGDHLVFTALSSILAVLFLVSLAVSLRREWQKRDLNLLLAYCCAPLVMSYAAWWWRPGSHPRYILMYALPVMLLLARVMRVLWKAAGWRRLLGTLLGLTILAVYGIGLESAYCDQRYYKDDVRSLGEVLWAEAGPEDAIIVDWNDYAVEYYYVGPAPILMAQGRDVESALEELAPMIAGRRRVFLVHNYKSIRGLRGFIPCLLELNGILASNRDFQGYNLRRYDDFSQTLLTPDIASVDVDFGSLRLTGVYVQPVTSAGDAVCVALRCVVTESPSVEYAAAVRVLDEAGHFVGEGDLILLNELSQTTSLWEAGEEAITYGVIPLPAGTPPLSYRVFVSFYDRQTLRGLDCFDASGAPAGQSCELGTVTLTRGETPGHDLYGALGALRLRSVDGIGSSEGLVLEAYRGSGDVVVPGQKYGIVLQWRASEDGMPDYEPRVLICQGDAIIGEDRSAPAGGRYPTTLWSAGEVVLDRRDVEVSPYAKDGPATLEIEIGSRRFHLADLRVKGVEHIYELPAMEHQLGVMFGGFAELLGYDLSPQVTTTEEPVALTLYWRVVSDEPPPVAYTIFTHLLNEQGRLVGQHDGPPVWGRRPTTSWVAGEIIVDRHEMVFKDTSHTGVTRVEVGIYDPDTLERVVTSSGADHVMLSSEVVVRP